MATFVDNFNRANGAVGSNYSSMSGLGTLLVNANACIANNIGACGMIINPGTATFGPDQEISWTFGTLSANDFAGCHVRGTTSGDGYAWCNDGSAATSIQKITGGSFSSLGGSSYMALPGKTYTLRVVDDTITLLEDGVVKLTEVDTTYVTGQPGPNYQWYDSRATTLDNMSATDAAAPTPPRRRVVVGAPKNTRRAKAAPRSRVFMGATLVVGAPAPATGVSRPVNLRRRRF